MGEGPSRLIANLLRPGALKHGGLSSVEFGLVASLRRWSVVRLAVAPGTDKGQISRALAADGPDGLHRPDAGGGKGGLV